LKDKNKIRLKNLSIQVMALLVINMLIILSVLQLSSVQTYLGRMLTKSIAKKTGYEIVIKKVDIQWLDRLVIEDVEVKDLNSKGMIYIEQAYINYKLVSLLGDRANVIDNISLSKPDVQLNLSDSSALNITTFISSLKKAYGPKKGKKPKPFIIRQISINGGTFSYIHESRTPLSNRFDPNNFGLNALNLQATDLQVVADTIALNFTSLSATETSTNLPINSFHSGFEVSNNHMLFNDLNLGIGNSIISDSVAFTYTSMADLSHFVEKVHVYAHFNKMKLATQDLKYFTPYFDTIYDTLRLQGTFKGYIKKFDITKMEIRFGEKSSLNANAYFEGLPDVYNTFINLKFRNSNLHKPDLALYIPAKTFSTYYPIDSAKVTGHFTGFPKDFVANGSFKTSIGKIRTDINLKLGKSPADSKYSGSLSLDNFDLGKLVNQEAILGKTTLTGKINGKGFTKSSAKFKLESRINQIDLYKYNYKNIYTNAQFTHELFDGEITVDDPNLQLNTKGIIDFRANKKRIELSGELAKAQLNALHIRSDTSSISAKFNVYVQGLSIDSIIGTIDVPELKATNNGQSYQVNNLELISEVKNNERIIVLYSDRVKMKLQGKFNLTTAYKDLSELWKHNNIKFRNESAEIDAYYNESNFIPHTSKINFDLELKNINPLLNLFDPLIYLSENTHIKGELLTGEHREFIINFDNDTIIYDHNKLINNKIRVVSKSKLQDKSINGQLKFDSETQILRSGSSLDSLSFLANWISDSLNFNFHIRQLAEQNVNKVEGCLIFNMDTTLLRIKKSQIQVLKQTWHINDKNLITFTKNNLLLSEMSIKSQNQSISAAGSISRNNTNPVLIKIKNVEMNNLNPLITNKLEGVINGSAGISNLFTTPLFETEFTIDSLTVDGYYFGNVLGNSNWNQIQNYFDVGFNVERANEKLVSIIGNYNPFGDQDALHLNARLINTDLKFAQPFTKIFSDIEGSVSGNINITGAVFKPIIIGSGNINNASLTIDYLKSKLEANGNWSLDSSSITLSKVHIKDDYIGTGTLDATFNHKNFKSFSMDLNADFEKLIVLNTVSKDNDYFYGTAIGSGNLSINGPFENLVITTRAKTEKGTKFYIPLSSSNSGTKQEDFISFSDFTTENEKAIIEVEEKVNLKNITVNLDIEVTPDAYEEIIFDLTAGDIIRGRGNGNLSLTVDTKGEFTMLGDYEFTEGAYNFTMYNIVNKEFDIKPKSKISFSGDPYLAKMEINANYNVNTSLTPIIDPVYQELPELKRIYPAEVLLDLNGPLLSPDIDFDIIIEDYPRNNVSVDTEVRAFLNKIKNDEQELNRQVFSLLVFRKFSPPDAFSTGGTIGSSVSEFVSNQLSYWISQVDENLTIDFDLGELDADALKTFQLRVSYAFMDGKLIVTRDGGFTDQNQEATLSSITGDWTVEYLLTQDGKLRIKLFKKTNYDQLSSSTGSNDELISGGFSLLYTTSFEHIKELFNKNKNKKQKDSSTSKETKEAIKPDDEENTP